MRPQDIDSIIIHCSATREGQDIKAADIRRWHLERGFADIGYHYVIDLDGTIEKGRLDNKTGAHCVGYNDHSIGICYVGGVGKNGKAKDTRTLAQKRAMHKLVFELLDKYTITKILGHRDTSPDKNGDGKITPNEWIKECPSFDVQAEFPIAVCVAKRKK